MRERADWLHEIQSKRQSLKEKNDEQAYQTFRQLIEGTKELARNPEWDLQTEWSDSCGWIELAFEALQCKSGSNPIHLHLRRLFESCVSYCFTGVKRYGRELTALTFHFGSVFFL